MAEKPIVIDPFACSPVKLIHTGSSHKFPEKGIALCLSGGGYRAMLFHLGALWRLNELGYLRKIERISSVSGGSITAAVLGFKWSRLSFDDNGVAQRFNEVVTEPIRKLAERTIDVPSIFAGWFSRGSIAEKVRDTYRKCLFGDATLQNLPDKPRFVINSTNVQSGALWRFMKPYMADYRVGMIKNPTIELATAAAASSACPPTLSPLVIRLNESDYTPDSGKDLQHKPFTTDVVLTDGGVYDNLGLETAWKRYGTILVSDAGGKMQPEPKPKRGWVSHSIRVASVIDNQVRALRKRQLIESFKLRDYLLDQGENPDSDLFKLATRDGTYWGIRTNIRDYELADGLHCPFSKTTQLANIPTRLRRLAPEIQERLINWGYGVCDAALRKHVDATLPVPGGFPYPIGVG